MFESLIHDSRINNFSFAERVSNVNISFEFSADNPLEYSCFSEIASSIPSRDTLKISLENEIEDILIWGDSPQAYSHYIVNSASQTIHAQIQITKSINNHYFSIYSYKHFENDLLSQPLDHILSIFSNLLNSSHGSLIFEIWEDAPLFSTKTMLFASHDYIIDLPVFNREKYLDVCKSISYFQNMHTFKLLPDDFSLESSTPDVPLCKHFDRISSILSLCYISSSSHISNSTMFCSINGHITLDYAIPLCDISHNPTLYQIYSWIMTDGNPMDKVLIARNIISLHCQHSPIISLDNKTIASIQSSFNLYLKKNVVQYIELRNKLNESIGTIITRSGEYATTFLDKFKSNLTAIFAFLFTTVLANIVSDQPLDNIFTADITRMLEVVLLGSVFYMAICKYQANYETNQAFANLGVLRNQYLDILSQEDLNQIFDNNRQLNEVKLTIKKSITWYMIVWLIFLFFAFIITELISSSPTIPALLKLLFKITRNILSFAT